MTAGSNPAGTSNTHAPLAQLDRVSDYESGGYEFDSCEARQMKNIDRLGGLLFGEQELASR